MIDVLGPEKRRRRTTQEKIAIVQQSFEPGMTVSLVARQHGVAASQLFLWRKQYQEGSLTAVAAGEQVVPASELAAAMKQIKELQRLLGKKTMENELLKEAVEYGRAKKWIAHAPLVIFRRTHIDAFSGASSAVHTNDRSLTMVDLFCLRRGERQAGI
ncbi:transposase, partial [Escherichia coli]|uniref:transposase n=2 Tax=Enterobacteriaceae TaxID=543 RepID=UPI00203D683D